MVAALWTASIITTTVAAPAPLVAKIVSAVKTVFVVATPIANVVVKTTSNQL